MSTSIPAKRRIESDYARDEDDEVRGMLERKLPLFIFPLLHCGPRLVGMLFRPMSGIRRYHAAYNAHRHDRDPPGYRSDRKNRPDHYEEHNLDGRPPVEQVGMVSAENSRVRRRAGFRGHRSPLSEIHLLAGQ